MLKRNNLQTFGLRISYLDCSKRQQVYRMHKQNESFYAKVKVKINGNQNSEKEG